MRSRIPMLQASMTGNGRWPREDRDTRSSWFPTCRATTDEAGPGICDRCGCASIVLSG
jgi:hypothetical protein